MVVCLGTFSLDLTFSECMSLFDILDANGDDSLDIREFTQGLYGHATDQHPGHQLFSDEKASARYQHTRAAH